MLSHNSFPHTRTYTHVSAYVCAVGMQRLVCVCVCSRECVTERVFAFFSDREILYVVLCVDVGVCLGE